MVNPTREPGVYDGNISVARSSRRTKHGGTKPSSCQRHAGSHCPSCRGRPKPSVGQRPTGSHGQKGSGRSSVCVCIATRHRYYRLRPDNLGKSALSLALLLDSGLSFEDLCVRHRGKSCIADPTLLPHPAAPILASLRSTGAPANLSSTQWTEAQRDAAAQRGPHKGTHEHIEFLRTEFLDMVRAGQWLVLPYRSVRHLPNLRLSPTGVVPQRDRRPRPIVDYHPPPNINLCIVAGRVFESLVENYWFS
jgi:hypothetical protein